MIKPQDLLTSVFRVFAVCMITVIFVFLFAFPVLTAIESISFKSPVAVHGHIDLAGCQLDGSSLVALDGEWDLFPNLYLEKYDEAALLSPMQFNLPVGKITSPYNSLTYRLYVKTGAPDEDLAIFIRSLKHDANVFVNGILQDSVSSISKNHKTIVRLKLDTTLPEQEIVLSFANIAGENPLYDRTVYLGTENTVTMYFHKTAYEAVFSFGIFIIIILFGNIFMFLHPRHKILSLITMLDTVIALRIVFNLNNVFDFLQHIFVHLKLTDSFMLSMQVFFLMLGGVFGVVLARNIFDEDKKSPRIFPILLTGSYSIMAVIFPLNLHLFSQIGAVSLISTLIITYAVILPQIYRYWQQNKKAYATVQIVKSVYFCVVVFLDVLYIDNKLSSAILIFAYMPIFLAHMFMRLFDNKQNYTAVELLNKNLEQTVEERTMELIRANKTLSELSVRDPLTGAYNRLYLEQTLDHILEQMNHEQEHLYLCLFDLDHFKRINDQFGHDAGDDQLKLLAAAATEVIGEDERVFLARIGGDEFVLLFKGMTGEEVMQILESVRYKVAYSAQKNPRQTTASFGVAQYQANMTQKDLFKLADKNMYRSKSAGGNKVT